MNSRSLPSQTLLGVSALLSLLGAGVPAVAAETSLRLTIPTDYMGGTRDAFITPADGTFTVRYLSDNSIQVQFSGPSFTNRWSLAFAAANRQPLAAGTYYDAVYSPGQPIDRNGFQVYGAGYSGCSSQTGSFEIKHVTLETEGAVADLWALFEGRCPGGLVIRGEFRFNAEVDVAVTAPLDVLADNGQVRTFPVTATSSAAGAISLSAINLPAGATFLDHGDGTGDFRWPIHFDLPGPYSIEFQAEDSLGRTDRTLTRVVVRGATSLLLDSDPHEFIGKGQTTYFTSDDGEFGTGFSTPNHVALTFGGPFFGPYWTMDFAAPPGQALAVGTYENAVAYFRQGPGQPGLLISGNSSGCGNVTGRFEVKELSFGPSGRPATFWASFEQHCEGLAPALRGEIRLNATVPLVLRAPTHLTAAEMESLSFDVHGFDSLGDLVALSATGLPAGATWVDNGDGTAHFDWTPAVGQAGIYTLAFHGVNGRGDADLMYTRIQVTLGFDDFDLPVRFSALPFESTVVDTSAASAAPDDPVCLGQVQATVWYAFTPSSDAPIYANTFAMYPGAILSVYRGARGGLTQVACGLNQVRFAALAGQTYYFMLGFYRGQQIKFSVDVEPPAPPNDDFDHATVVETLPFTELLDTRSATPAADDPAQCANVLGPVSTVWYAYTPAEDTRVTIDTTGSDYSRLVTVLTGARGSLGRVACDFYGLTFTAHAGTTYYLMIASPFGIPGGHLVLSITGRPVLNVQVSVAPRGSIDLRVGAAVIQGTVTCSRPAQVSVSGALVEGPTYIYGNFDLDLACEGTTTWTARVTPYSSRYRSGGFRSGRADFYFNARGVALDDPGDFAMTNGQGTVLLPPMAPVRRLAPSARPTRTPPPSLGHRGSP